MIPDNVQKKIKDILKNKDFSEGDGDKVIIKEKGDNIFYGYVESKKRGSFGQLIMDGKNLSFLWGSSATNPETLLDRFKSGLRSMPHQKRETRRNVRLPVIADKTAILDFADKMTTTFMELFDKPNDHDPLKDQWRDMIYYALVLLLSAKEEDTKLIFITMVYHKPSLVKTYLAKVEDRKTHDYWTKEVPQFMKRNDANDLVHLFDVRIASLIGEQEIQNLCRNYSNTQK